MPEAGLAGLETGGTSNVQQAELRGARHDVAGVQEAHTLQPVGHAHAQFAVQDDHPVAPDRESGGTDGALVAQPIEGEAAHGGVATGKEAVADGE